MGDGKRILALMSAVVILGTAGYALAKNNPYNNSNITFINQSYDMDSREMENFINKDFNRFNEIMNGLQNGNYEDYNYQDINLLDRYINLITSCNFRGYGGDMWRYRDRYQQGFVIEFENYFPNGSPEKALVERFSEYYESIITNGYKYEKPDVMKFVEACTTDYHTYKNQIYQLPYFPRYIILKLIRPIIAANESQYVTPNCFYYRDKILAEIDREISNCLMKMQKQCSNPEVNYNVSRR